MKEPLVQDIQTRVNIAMGLVAIRNEVTQLLQYTYNEDSSDAEEEDEETRRLRVAKMLDYIENMDAESRDLIISDHSAYIKDKQEIKKIKRILKKPANERTDVELNQIVERLK